MPRYLSVHTLACLTRQGAEQLAMRLASAGVMTRRVQVDLFQGKMLIEFEAADRGTLEAWLAAEGFHYDWIMRVELELEQGKLTAIP